MLRIFKTALRWTLGGIAAFFVLTNMWVWSAGWGRLTTDASQVPADSIVILLGTNQYMPESREPTGTYQPRIDATIELCRQAKVKAVVCSGLMEQSLSMAQQLEAAGVKCPLIEDPYGWRTLDSVVRAKAYYPQEHIVFISQDWHCVRALWLADRAGLNASAYPAGFGSGVRVWRSWLRDFFAKPKAIIDWVMGDELQTSMPANEGNHPHR